MTTSGKPSSSDDPSTERSRDERRHPRVTWGRRVWCESEGFTLYLPALNLSAGGIHVRCPGTVPIGAKARLVIPAAATAAGETDREIVATAEVVWSRAGGRGPSYGIGLRFISIDAGDQLLERCVRTRLISHRA